jgi:hypothetical protein
MLILFYVVSKEPTVTIINMKIKKKLMNINFIDIDQNILFILFSLNEHVHNQLFYNHLKAQNLDLECMFHIFVQ